MKGVRIILGGLPSVFFICIEFVKNILLLDHNKTLSLCHRQMMTYRFWTIKSNRELLSLSFHCFVFVLDCPKGA